MLYKHSIYLLYIIQIVTLFGFLYGAFTNNAFQVLFFASVFMFNTWAIVIVKTIEQTNIKIISVINDFRADYLKTKTEKS
jgi:hypothetical protein